MGILNNNEEKKINYEVVVSSVKKLKKGVGFTLTVNGVSIYQMRAYDYKNANGEEKVTINFPSYMLNYQFVNYVFFPLTHEIRESIISQITEQLKNG